MADRFPRPTDHTDVSLMRRHSSVPICICRRRRPLLLLLLLCSSWPGCAAFHPIRGVPAPYVPPEYLGPSRSGKKTIDLSLLVQTQPDQYRVAAGDTLSIYIPGVLGSLTIEEQRQIGETPPINLPTNPSDPPTIGYPITVRDDGTIALPYVPPINVHGMTLPEIELAIRSAYTQDAKILNPDRDRVLVSLQRRREVSVIVVRQETSSELTLGAQPGTLNVGNSKRGTARTVRLPAYENDVLHALASSQQGADGLPGLDAKNTIYIIRRKKKSPDPLCDVSLPTELPRGPVADPSGPVTPTGPAIPQEPPLGLPESLPEGRSGVPNNRPNSVSTLPSRAAASLRTRGQERVVASRSLTKASQSTRPAQSPPGPLQALNPETIPVAEEAGRAPAWPSSPQQPSATPDRAFEPGQGVAPPWPQVRSQTPSRQFWGHSDQPLLSAPGPVPTPGAGGPVPLANELANSSRPGDALICEDPAIGWPEAAAAPFGGHDDSWRSLLAADDPTVDNPNVIKIPIRLSEGERPTFTERDIILEDGDIVFIESRETEVFYTGGLLGGGQYTLPRDYDLRVLEAISIAQSPQNTQGALRAIGGASALNQDVTISASHVVILRTLPNGTRIPIEVDLYKAVRRPQENILVQPGDLLILQYTKLEAIAAFFERHLLEGALFGIAAAQLDGPGTN